MKLKHYLNIVPVLLAGTLFGQSQIKKIDAVPAKVVPQLTTLDLKDNLQKRGMNPAKGGGGDLVVYWSEDFSNGLDGAGDNGEWSTAGAQGGLWFQTFPPLSPNGYNTDELIPEYGNVYPNFNDGLNDDVITFNTAENGFMMFDADRANSTQTDPNSMETLPTFNTLDGQLISPPIDLTGIEFAQLSFWERWRLCCFAFSDALSIDFSTDGGLTWIAFSLFDLTPDDVVNPPQGGPLIETQPAIDISPFLQNASDLTDCRVRVRWNPAEDIPAGSEDFVATSHYYMMIDDIEITSLPSNNLVAEETFFNDYWFNIVGDIGPEYVTRFENFEQPDYATDIFNFATIVRNAGELDQTGIRLTVRAFLNGDPVDPSGDTDVFISDPIGSLAAGESDTLFINNVSPSWWIDEETNPEPGVYTFEFEVSQDQIDDFPSNNFGLNRTTRVSTDAGNDGFAIMQNDGNQYQIFYPDLAEDVIWGHRFVFDEIDVVNDMFITHVEFALAGTEQAMSQPDEEIFVNVGTGNVFVGDATDLDAVDRFFDEDELPYVIAEEELTTSGALNWISYELPTPILVTPGEIYQAELFVPEIGSDLAFPCHSSDQELGASAIWIFADGDWGGTGTADEPSYDGASTCLRFRTQDQGALNLNEAITYESGIKLVQNYPNPVVDNTKIQFQLDEASPVTFQVFDITGKLVHQEDLGNVARLEARVIDFNASEFATGTYTYSIVTETERVSRNMTIE
ncbi:MAG: T9SS type A sorting domain-containing protein [Bacteroidota bacterium]